MKTKLSLLVLAAGLLAGVLAASPSETVRVRLEADRPVIRSGQRETVILKVSLEGLHLPRATERPPVNLCLVIDRSGSMGGQKIHQAMEAAVEAVRRLGPDDVFSLVAYGSQVETLIPATRMRDARGIEARIRGIQIGGMTNLHGGVTAGAAEIRRHVEGPYTHRVILLSDGIANIGPSSPEELGRLGAALVREGISVTTIGLGLDYNEDLMTRLARRSDGNTYFVEASRDLPRIFNEELGDVLAIVARRVVVEIDFPAGVHPKGFIGRDGVIEGRRGTLSLNQIYGGQEQFALIEVEVDPGADGAVRELASVRAKYEQARGGRADTGPVRTSIRHTRDDREVISSANHGVQTDYAANLMAVTRDHVVDLVDEGRTAEAAAEMRSRAESLDEMARTFANPSVASISAKESAEADRIEKDGLDATGRKNYRTKNAQTYGQQRAN